MLTPTQPGSQPGTAGRHLRSVQEPPSSSPKRRHTFNLLFGPDEMLDIRPLLSVDTDDIGEVDSSPKASKYVDGRSLKSRL